jgi:hypothetical protein
MKCLPCAAALFLFFSGRIRPLARSAQGAASLVMHVIPDKDANDSPRGEEESRNFCLSLMLSLVKNWFAKCCFNRVLLRAIGNKWIDSFDFAGVHPMAENSPYRT